VEKKAPFWEVVRNAPDAAAFKALIADTDETATGLKCNVIVLLLPSLAYHLFSPN
jgi:hypothetical protein